MTRQVTAAINQVVALQNQPRKDSESGRWSAFNHAVREVKAYDGSDPKECNNWLTNMWTFAKQAKLPLSQALARKSQGLVLTFVNGLNPQLTDQQVFTKVSETYSDLKTRSDAMYQFQTIRQRPGETVEAFFVRYKFLFVLVTGCDTYDIIQEHDLEKFAQSLVESVQVKVMKSLLDNYVPGAPAHLRRYKTLDDACALAKKSERNAHLTATAKVLEIHAQGSAQAVAQVNTVTTPAVGGSQNNTRPPLPPPTVQQQPSGQQAQPGPFLHPQQDLNTRREPSRGFKKDVAVTMQYMLNLGLQGLLKEQQEGKSFSRRPNIPADGRNGRPYFSNPPRRYLTVNEIDSIYQDENFQEEIVDGLGWRPAEYALYNATVDIPAPPQPENQ